MARRGRAIRFPKRAVTAWFGFNTQLLGQRTYPPRPQRQGWQHGAKRETQGIPGHRTAAAPAPNQPAVYAVYFAFISAISFWQVSLFRGIFSESLAFSTSSLNSVRRCAAVSPNSS